MTEALYERYKDALRRGHVAALRGRLDSAILAYEEAARIAPERALPHTSLGSVLARLGRVDEAVAAYAVALDRAPSDETALTGWSDVLAGAGRRTDAANVLDRLASAQEAGGRLEEALATITRALALAESRVRRRQAEALERRIGEARAAEAAEDVDRVRADRAEAESPDAAAVAEEPALGEPEPEPEPERVPASELAERAEDLLDAGDRDAALPVLLAASSAYLEDGLLDAALDACYLALAVAPDDPGLHLVLAEVYLRRGWRTHAARKLALLANLAELDGEPEVRERVCRLANELPDDRHLAAICA